ncbi:MAG: M28 family peptidase [Acidobacteriota bacterium]|nr:M28 family peptidase [Acidobacteriota bacterium]
MLAAQPRVALAPGVEAALDRITAASLRGNLSFLASDALEGRDTPSRGLDIAAEFIASQFRRAGLEPAGDDGYFQTARLVTRKPNLDGFTLELSAGEEHFTAAANDVAITSPGALSLLNAPLVKAGAGEPLAGKVVIDERRDFAAGNTLRDPAIPAIILVGSGGPRGSSAGLRIPDDPEGKGPVVIRLSGETASKFYAALKPGVPATASIHLAAPIETQVTARNVVGVLRGSDEELKQTCVMVSAHYDHLGMKPAGEGDRIYNGANDDGSGTVSVVELAGALAGMPRRAKRSILFAAFFGEEKGLVGSRYYALHPVFPLNKTVADVNLEQLGRTDGDGAERHANVTGFDYSTVTEFLVAAGGATGVKVLKNEQRSDPFFRASDNYSLAKEGVPAHTVSVTYLFPDYHQPGDEWQKIDYENMARVDRMLAAAVIAMAESAEPPRWLKPLSPPPRAP